jgi:hypothetical protein
VRPLNALRDLQPAALLHFGRANGASPHAAARYQAREKSAFVLAHVHADAITMANVLAFGRAVVVGRVLQACFFACVKQQIPRRI